MRIPIQQLPEPIRERLLRIQANPSAYDCFYRQQGGMGIGIFGLVVAGLGVLGMLAWAVGDEMPMAAGIIGGLLLGAMAWGSVSRIRRVSKADIKPAVLLNPLYFARITLDHVTFHGLWSELRDLKITHHHTNGVYTFTQFEFFFKKGAKEPLVVKPKAKAEQLADLIEHYRVRMIQAIETQNMEGILGHDLFLEARADEEGQPRRYRAPKGNGRSWALAFGVGGGVGAVVGFALFFLSYAGAQQRSYEYCSTVRSCSYYFGRWAVPLYTEEAQQKLTRVYKREWERNKTSVRKLRLMAQLERVEHVTPAQAKEILALYREGSQKELRARYQQAIDKYKQVSGAANPTARAALIKMLELARDTGYYRVKVSYRGVTEKIKGPMKLPPKARGRHLVSMGPSFTDKLNRSRESLITRRIHSAFMEIVPQDVLEFPGINDSTVPTSRSSRYRRYDSARVRYGALARELGLKDDTEERQKGPAELKFEVAYVVFPSGSLYVSRKNPSSLYMGIGFDWLVRIKVKDQVLYNLRQQSYPPPRFTVTSYGSRYAPAVLGAGTVYAKMATTAFDNFSKKIVKHFGIPVTERKTRPRYRRGLSNRRGTSGTRGLNGLSERLRRKIQESLRKNRRASAL